MHLQKNVGVRGEPGNKDKRGEGGREGEEEERGKERISNIDELN